MMKLSEPEAYLNPLQAAMFAGDNHWQLARQEREASAPEFSLSLGGASWSKEVYETQAQKVANSLLDAVSDYFHRETMGPGSGEGYANYGSGQNAFIRVVERLRQLNRQLTIKSNVTDRASFVDKSAGFEKTAFYAVSFARAVNISIPVDCVDLQRWYTALRTNRSV